MSPAASWLLVVTCAALVWWAVGAWNRWQTKRALRDLEDAIAAATAARAAYSTTLRNHRRYLTMHIDDMTPEQFRQALDEIDTEPM